MKCPKCSRSHAGQPIQGGRSVFCQACRNVANEKASLAAANAAGAERAGDTKPDPETPTKPRTKKPR